LAVAAVEIVAETVGDGPEGLGLGLAAAVLARRQRGHDVHVGSQIIHGKTHDAAAGACSPHAQQ
jgi:hypothetical protein